MSFYAKISAEIHRGNRMTWSKIWELASIQDWPLCERMNNKICRPLYPHQSSILLLLLPRSHPTVYIHRPSPPRPQRRIHSTRTRGTRPHRLSTRSRTLSSTSTTTTTSITTSSSEATKQIAEKPVQPSTLPIPHYLNFSTHHTFPQDLSLKDPFLVEKWPPPFM